MVQQLDLKLVILVIQYIIQTENVTYSDTVSYLANTANETEDWASNWINLFINAICKFNLKEFDSNFAYAWIKEQSKNLDATQIASMLSSTIANLLLASSDEIDTVNVILDGKVIQTITKFSDNFPQPPTGIHSVHFADINVNTINGEREVIVTVDRWSYSLSWDKLPDRFKQLYVAWLQLLNVSVPDDLQQYITNTIDISNLYFDINLDEAVLLNEV